MVSVLKLVEYVTVVCSCRPDRDPRERTKAKQVSVEPPQKASHDVVASQEIEDLKVLDEVLAKARHVKVQLQLCV